MESLIRIKLICSSISLATSATVAILFILNKNLRTPTFRLVLQLQIADALFAIASLINSSDENNSLCQFQAFMVNYSRESSIIWIAIFAYNMYVTIVDNLLIPGLLKFYVIAIGIPLVLSVYPFIGSAYGFNYCMCWIQPNRIMYVVINYFVFCICILFYIIIFYVKTFNFLNEVTEMKSYKLFLYPAAFFITQIWTMIDILQKYDENSSIAFKSIAVAFISLQGFINSLVYGLTPQVLEILKQLFKRNKIQQEQEMATQETEQSRQQSFIMPMGMIGLDSRTASNTSVQEANFTQQQINAIKQQQQL